MRDLSVQQQSAVDSDDPVFRRVGRPPDMATPSPARQRFIEQGYICRYIGFPGLSRARLFRIGSMVMSP
jgi:hypothetical protein